MFKKNPVIGIFRVSASKYSLDLIKSLKIYQTLVIRWFLRDIFKSKVDLEPCQTSDADLFPKSVNDWKPLTDFAAAKLSILNVCEDSDCTSVKWSKRVTTGQETWLGLCIKQILKVYIVDFIIWSSSKYKEKERALD